MYNNTYVYVDAGALQSADEAAREDDSGHGEGSVSKRGHPVQVNNNVFYADDSIFLHVMTC